MTAFLWHLLRTVPALSLNRVVPLLFTPGLAFLPSVFLPVTSSLELFQRALPLMRPQRMTERCGGMACAEWFANCHVQFGTFWLTAMPVSRVDATLIRYRKPMRPTITQLPRNVSVWISTSVPPPCLCQTGLDHHRELLAHLHSTVPSVPWTIDVDDHLQLIKDHLHDGLERHFVAEVAKPRQPHISPDLWQAVRDRRHAAVDSPQQAFSPQRMAVPRPSQLAAQAWQSSHGFCAVLKTERFCMRPDWGW